MTQLWGPVCCEPPLAHRARSDAIRRAKTILVVDDQAVFREPIEAVLRTSGFQVVTASNGVEALAATSKYTPDLVLLDLGMPVMDGLEALRTIRKRANSRAIPVLILSAESDRERIVEAAKLGISGYLLKAKFSLKVMLERVRKELDGPKPASGAVGVGAKAPPLEADPIATTPTSSGSDAPPPAVIPRTVALQRDDEAAQADLKALRPLMTRSQLIEQVTAESELTGFSPTVSMVLKITSSENCSMEQVAKAVSQDHAIALKILKLANSSVYSRGDLVDSVNKAVRRIGMSSIRQAVLNIGVVERFASMAFEQHLSTQLFWEHSIATGIIAAELAHALKHKEPDIAFTAGLLHDLGRVILAERLGEQYVEVLDTAREMQVPLEDVESRLLLMSHAEVMDKLLHAWHFPKDLVNPIVFHHVAAEDAKSIAPNQVSDVVRLGLADRLAHAMMLGSSGNDTIYPTEEHCRLLGIEVATVRLIEQTARQQADDTKFALLTTSNRGAWPRCVEQHRSALTAPFRPLYVSAAPELDAFRIFCNELGGPSGLDAPNVAVVHIAAVKERGLVAERLLTAEQDNGVTGLPLLVLSPNGQLGLNPKAVGNRACFGVATPTPISRFIATVNAMGLEERQAAA